MSLAWEHDQCHTAGGDTQVDECVPLSLMHREEYERRRHGYDKGSSH